MEVVQLIKSIILNIWKYIPVMHEIDGLFSLDR